MSHAASRLLLARVRALIGARDSVRGQLVKGTVGTLALWITLQLLSLATAILLARLLGPDGYGIYAFAIAVVTLLAIPVQLGLPDLLVRTVALYEQRHQWSLIKGLLVRANQVVLALSLLVAAAGVTVVLSLPRLPDDMPKDPLIWAFGLLPLFALVALRGAALRGLRRVALGQLPEGLIRPVLFLLLVAFSALFAAISPVVVIQLNLLATGIAFAAGVWFLRSALPGSMVGIPSQNRTREWLKASVPFLVSGGVQVVLRQTDIVMLGLLATQADLGVYRVVSQGGMLVAFVLRAINLVVMPHIAQLHERGDLGNLQKMAVNSARVAAAGTLPFVLLFVLFGSPVLGFVFGLEFMRGDFALALLSIGKMMNATLGFVGVILAMSGFAWYATLGVAGAAAVNIILNAALIPLYGIEGAAFASSLSEIVSSLLLTYFVVRLVGFNPTVFARLR